MCLVFFFFADEPEEPNSNYWNDHLIRISPSPYASQDARLAALVTVESGPPRNATVSALLTIYSAVLLDLLETI
ncbi:hypothetical protein T265_11850 [Opisthorchis viverrini]|uniref:Uncharacterized protein n=1 Tax=Opisthorchis viverrini TaxID=6198 RepID=A0A074Z7X9_OPIVI|nr:hypothetical protein T265_11850 [Opisthorchis viverrini]KER19350.1 hypothetical protein T265_11850 [Opisthorchis viverrini]